MKSPELDEELRKFLRTLLMSVTLVGTAYGVLCAVLYAYQLGVSDATHVRCKDVAAAREGRLKPRD